jgi:hypothetical protein
VKLIMQHLVQTLEPGGLRGPGIVARDIAAAAQVQLRLASSTGIPFSCRGAQLHTQSLCCTVAVQIPCITAACSGSCGRQPATAALLVS